MHPHEVWSHGQGSYEQEDDWPVEEYEYGPPATGRYWPWLIYFLVGIACLALLCFIGLLTGLFFFH